MIRAAIAAVLDEILPSDVPSEEATGRALLEELSVSDVPSEKWLVSLLCVRPVCSAGIVK